MFFLLAVIETIANVIIKDETDSKSRNEQVAKMVAWILARDRDFLVFYREDSKARIENVLDLATPKMQFSWDVWTTIVRIVKQIQNVEEKIAIEKRGTQILLITGNTFIQKWPLRTIDAPIYHECFFGQLSSKLDLVRKFPFAVIIEWLQRLGIPITLTCDKSCVHDTITS